MESLQVSYAERVPSRVTSRRVTSVIKYYCESGVGFSSECGCGCQL